MALQVTVTDPDTGLSVTNAYVKLNSLTVDAVAQTIALGLGIYVDAAHRQSNPERVVLAWTDTAGPDVFAAMVGQPEDVRATAYAWLKANDARLGSAIDV